MKKFHQLCFITLSSLFVIMTITTSSSSATAFTYLIPAQIPGAKHVTTNNHHHRAALTLSNENDEEQQSSSASSSSAGDDVIYRPTISDDDAASLKSRSSTRRYTTRQRTGDLPDVHWRSIPMSHLRAHPNFQPLPPPSQLSALPTKEHVRYFRQESWQWDYLHRGRCTTSQTAAALGFLESKAAHYLGIPNSLRRGGYSAWQRLREEVPSEIENLTELERVLCEGRADNNNISNATSTTSDGAAETYNSWRPGTKESERLWISSQQLRQRRHNNNITTSSTSSTSYYHRKPFPFSAKYIPSLTRDELRQRKMYVEHIEQSPSPMATRMRWGNAQEATSVLTALNYFCGLDEDTVIREVGMCGAGFDPDVDNSDTNVRDGALLQGLSIGATPDALVCHSDGTVEVLEVKNHCPFVWNKISPHYTGNKGGGGGGGNRNRNKKKKKLHSNRRRRHQNSRKLNDDIADDYGDGEPAKKFAPKHYLIRDFHLERRIPPVYIPQLMMEILCVGNAVDLDGNAQSSSSSEPLCKSAVMVRQTATKGAIMLRLNRDEEWITEMQYFLGRFKKEYVDTGIIPEDNFFWESGGERYHKFLERTKELSESVEFVAFIDHQKIQRVVFEHSVKGEIDLFLDEVDVEEED
mmetsp:Transcript_17904/g.30309  ORF Transcript_17904/g.30309 Transcript_17904/m.30309 type:complete len:638 (-) Transcript_17904:3244-5157(-)